MTTETDYTDDDVARLAEMFHGQRYLTSETIARRLLAKGVTLPPPPPDTAVVVAEALAIAVNPTMPWPCATWQTDLLAAVRDLFPPEALAAAAAKVQEADRG